MAHNEVMFKNQKGFHLIVALLVLAVLSIAVLGIIKISNNQGDVPDPDQRGPNYKALQACGKTPLNTLPMDPSRLEFIAPMGNIDTPDHTLPTDHMYMMYPYGTSDQKEIYAPANVVVTAIGYADAYENGALKTGDYSITMYPCRELKIIFGHVDKLGDKLGVQADPNKAGGQCRDSKQGREEIKNCDWNVDITMPAGEFLGTTDGWDLWATMEGSVSPNVVSPEYYHNVDAVCPLDYFTADLKTQLYALVKRDREPKCGEAYQDKTGTLQGGWFAHKDPNKAKTDWSSHFSLAHHSIESGVGMLAVAGTITDDFIYRFTPRHSGTINREPSETTAGTLYCYEHEGDPRTPNGVIAGTGKVLLKLTNNHEMQIEHKAGDCGSDEAFTKPVTYYR